MCTFLGFSQFFLYFQRLILILFLSISNNNIGVPHEEDLHYRRINLKFNPIFC